MPREYIGDGSGREMPMTPDWLRDVTGDGIFNILVDLR